MWGRTIIGLFLLGVLGCAPGPGDYTLQEVTAADFERFVGATGYLTDSERFGWTFQQVTVHSYKVVRGVNFRNDTYPGDEVTQVSYDDATAYCEWAGVRLPTLEEYWNLSTADQRKDVWDWTQESYLAGGSYLCSIQTCAGFQQGNEKRDISLDTTNSHIGFCVVVDRS